MTYVISYDIESNKIRTKLAKLLEGYGVRIQYSVFECNLSDKRFKKFIPLTVLRFYRSFPVLNHSFYIHLATHFLRQKIIP